MLCWTPLATILLRNSALARLRGVGLWLSPRVVFCVRGGVAASQPRTNCPGGWDEGEPFRRSPGMVGAELVPPLPEWAELASNVIRTRGVFEYVGGLSMSLRLSLKADFAFADFLHCLPVSPFAAFCSHCVINFLLLTLGLIWSYFSFPELTDYLSFF